MKRFVMIAIAFFTVMSFSQTQLQKPSELVAQQKSSGAKFNHVELFSLSDQQKSNVELPKELTEYSLFTVDESKMKSMRGDFPETMNISVPGQKSAMSLDLVKVDIFTDDYQAIEMPSGRVLPRNKDVAHYRGIVKGNSNSLVAISFYGQKVGGFISVGGEHGNIVLGEVKNSKNHIIYKDKQMGHLYELGCQVEDDAKGYTAEDLKEPSNSKAAAKCVKIFFDIGRNVVNDKGGAQQATNFMQSLFNQVIALYANDNIALKLSGTKAWTTNTPFNADGQNMSRNLDNYLAYLNQNGINGDLGHYVSYGLGGGIAGGFGTFCNSRRRGAISGIKGSFSNVPTYSFDVFLLSHEIGHNVGSRHTHACVWNGNNTAIDGCAGRVEGNCRLPGLPSGGGTIMSYCPQTSVGVNFNKGFGTQPKNVIHNAIARASCLQSCDGGGCNTGDPVSVTFRNSSDCTLEYYENNVRKGSANAGGTYRANTTVGSNWQAKKSSGETKDNFSITCNQTEYTSSGSCGGGPGGNCDGVRPYTPGTVYSIGDRVTYRGSLYELTASGWRNLGPCTSTNDPCDGVRPYSPGTVYSIGDKVTYRGSLYELTASGWRRIGTCGGSRNAFSTEFTSFDDLDIAKEFSIKAYPNPVDDLLTLEISNLGVKSSHIRIKDINGRTLEVMSLDTPPDGLVVKTIDVSKLSAGIYFVQVTNTKQTLTKKVFVK
ncbi:T9SS type A sorting domain-containing protein [Aquimarina sp. TRL1]|uniref:M12 family metallo-peptidase n=1 Tax=Aquimarina sp. (strain TRL1) TaxID=2736252 RepID=UPI0015898E2C|nr:M12 family metallo-peptidase [Aquimarina sp. TRL1]QKX06485.1 T9SS type A sorting domain-containing protein [Aquimarina sp. TRL1]